MIANAWYPVGWLDEFANERPAERIVVGRPIVMWLSQAGHPVAFENRCSHKRFPLSHGKFIRPDVLQCGYHGFCYDSDGNCVEIPALGEGESIPSRTHLRRYPVAERDGMVWLWPGDPQKAQSETIPSTSELTSPDYDRYIGLKYEVDAHYRLLLENLADLTHYFPLHESTIGNPENNRNPTKVSTKNDRVEIRRYARNYNVPPLYLEYFGWSVVDRDIIITIESPGLATVDLHVAPPEQLGTEKKSQYKFLHFACPESDERFIWRWAVVSRVAGERTSSLDKPLAEAAGIATLEVAKEDLWALEQQQRMFHFEDDGYEEVGIKGDAPIFAVRRFIKRMEEREREEVEEAVTRT